MCVCADNGGDLQVGFAGEIQCEVRNAKLVLLSKFCGGEKKNNFYEGNKQASKER